MTITREEASQAADRLILTGLVTDHACRQEIVAAIMLGAAGTQLGVTYPPVPEVTDAEFSEAVEGSAQRVADLDRLAALHAEYPDMVPSTDELNAFDHTTTEYLTGSLAQSEVNRILAARD